MTLMAYLSTAFTALVPHFSLFEMWDLKLFKSSAVRQLSDGVCIVFVAYA